MNPEHKTPFFGDRRVNSDDDDDENDDDQPTRCVLRSRIKHKFNRWDFMSSIFNEPNSHPKY